jgi:hypothetical protein
MARRAFFEILPGFESLEIGRWLESDGFVDEFGDGILKMRFADLQRAFGDLELWTQADLQVRFMLSRTISRLITRIHVQWPA